MVARDIAGETILVPIYKHSDDINCIYSLNETGSLIWKMLNGKNTIAQVKKQILDEFDGPAEQIDKTLSGFLSDLKEAKAISY